MRGIRIEMQNRPRICTAGRWHFSPAFLPSPPAGCLWLQSGQIVKSFCLGGPKNYTLDRPNCSFGQIASWGIIEPIIANALRRMNCQTVRTVLLAEIGFFREAPSACHLGPIGKPFCKNRVESGIGGEAVWLEWVEGRCRVY